MEYVNVQFEISTVEIAVSNVKRLASVREKTSENSFARCGHNHLECYMESMQLYANVVVTFLLTN